MTHHYEYVIGAAPTGDAPTACEWSTILLPTKLCLKWEVSHYINLKMGYKHSYVRLYQRHFSETVVEGHKRMITSHRKQWL